MGDTRVEPLAPDDLRSARLAAYIELWAAATEVSPRTAAGYLSQLDSYDRFLAAHGVVDEGDPDVVAAYALASWRLGYAALTISARLTAINWRHRATKGDVTFAARRVNSHFGRGKEATESHQAVVLSISASLALSRSAGIQVRPESFGELAALRNRAIVNVGMAGKLRPIEMTFADAADFTRATGGYWLDLPISKTNRNHHRNERVWLAERDDDLDPVGILDLLLGNLDERAMAEGPAFPSRFSLDGDRYGIGPADTRYCLKQAARRAGITDAISGYSLRRSAATLDYLAGTPIQEISASLRHRSVETTILYLADLPDLTAAAFLDPGAPPAWTEPPARPDARGPWTAAGTLESLVGDAREIAAEEALIGHPGTRYEYRRVAERWCAFAKEEGTDPDHPLPEIPAWFLVTEADRGVKPSTIRRYLAALTWWLSTVPQPATEAIAFAGVVAQAIGRVQPDPEVKRRAERVPESTLVRLIEAPAPTDWISWAQAVVLRATGLKRDEVRRAACDVVLDERCAQLALGDARFDLVHVADEVHCAACALGYLVQQRPDGRLFHQHGRTVWGVTHRATGIDEPSAVPDDEWRRLVDNLARSLRTDRRTRASIAIAYGGLTPGMLRALYWEHLAEETEGLVARTAAGAHRLQRRSDSLDPELALRGLARVWPWRGDGLWGCAGPVMAGMVPDRWHHDRRSVAAQVLGVSLNALGRPLGIEISLSDVRVSGALDDWHRHPDVVRLMRRLGLRSVASAETFLRSYGLSGVDGRERR